VSSIPGDFNDIVLCGAVLQTHIVRQHITGILLKVKAADDAPLIIAITPVRPLPQDFTQRGDRLWAKGRLCSSPVPEKKALHFVEALHLAVVRRQHQPTSAPMAEGRRLS
jgi:hypothetical protein